MEGIRGSLALRPRSWGPPAADGDVVGRRDVHDDRLGRGEVEFLVFFLGIECYGGPA